MEYIEKNENGQDITLVRCIGSEDDASISMLVDAFKRAGAFLNLNIKFMYLDKHFNPEAIDELVNKYMIPRNRIFIGSIHHFHEFDYGDLGGVRIIT